ncbi:unnamed protein product [Prorocentrum cordatum]|uniref:Uncharacterized protein n=2 Tax=Prorocentrum cordatum TaxID=2364126 RepID=A0ABN9V273_9DINO|nr:unnamed protein product [Polarella glacialis]
MGRRSWRRRKSSEYVRDRHNTTLERMSEHRGLGSHPALTVTCASDGKKCLGRALRAKARATRPAGIRGPSAGPRVEGMPYVCVFDGFAPRHERRRRLQQRPRRYSNWGGERESYIRPDRSQSDARRRPPSGALQPAKAFTLRTNEGPGLMGPRSRSCRNPRDASGEVQRSPSIIHQKTGRCRRRRRA